VTERKRFCVRGHDTFEVGRDSSYRCLRCKAESGAAARRVRKAAEDAVRDAERLRQAEESAAADARPVLPFLGPIQQLERRIRLGVGPDVHVCEWRDGLPDACTNRTIYIFCGRHMNQAKRDAAAEAIEAVRRRGAATHSSIPWRYSTERGCCGSSVGQPRR
jgi:hypothetical protein